MSNKVPPSAIPVPGKEATHGGDKRTIGTLDRTVKPAPKGVVVPHKTASTAGRGGQSKPLPKRK